MKTNFKAGQEVECLIYGKGVVISDRDKSGLSCDYPVEVKFLMKNPNDAFGIEYKIETYTADGRLYTDSNITLTPGTWEVKEILPEPEFEQGEPVWVRDDPSEMWKFAYYNKLTNNENYKHEVCDSKGITYNYKYVKKFIGQDPNE